MNTGRESRGKLGTKELFESAPISQAVWAMALPTIVTQLINIIYNYADTWFVGRTGNPAMVAALGLCFPIFVILAAVANLFGVGGASMISRAMGRGDKERARQTFSTAFWGGMAAAVLYMAVMAIFRTQIIYLIGGDDSDFAYVWDYIFWTMIIGAVPTIGNVLAGHLVRAVGASKEAGFGMSMGGVLNIFLDPLFMFVILPSGMEVTGAAIATLLSNTISFLYFLVYIIRRQSRESKIAQEQGKKKAYDEADEATHDGAFSIVTIRPKNIARGGRLMFDIIISGIPSAVETALAMVSNIVVNVFIRPYGSEAVAGMGIAKKINMIAFNTCMGMTMGVLPLIGYSYGARNYKRMRKIIRYTATVVVAFGTLCTVLFIWQAPNLVRFFINEETSVAYGTQFLRVIAFAAPLAALSYLGVSMFQGAGRQWQAFILAILRKGVFDIPAMFVFNELIGVIGVCWATPFAEVLALIVAAIMYARFMKEIREEDSQARA